MLGLFYGEARAACRQRAKGIKQSSAPMYPVLPNELMIEAIQMMCYFFTALAALVGCALVRS